jgi:putative ABC transport system permease protein
MDRGRSGTRRPWRLLPRSAARRAADELRAELDLYIELRAEELREDGFSPDEALQQAHAAFGDRAAIVNDCLGTTTRRYWRRRREETLGSLIRDMKFAIRSLRRAPRLVVAVCLTLALGIGANSAIFSVVNAVVLQPLPYPDADRLFQVWTQYPAQGDFEFPVSNAEFLDYAAESELFEDMTAYAVLSRVLTEHGQPRAVEVAFANAAVWDIFGARPALGRLFDVDDDQPDSENVAVLSHATWTNVFGAVPTVIGQSVAFNGVATTIIGVLEENFSLPEAPADIYQPLGIRRDVITNRSGHYLTVVGRAQPGATLAGIEGEMATVTARWTAAYEHAHPLAVEPLAHEVVGDSSTALLVVLAAVAAVLLIACANVAGLMLTRAIGRQREMAIRTAIGASRNDLARQLMVEGVVLAGLGGLLGLGLATVALPLILTLEPGDLPRLAEVGMNGTVVAFTAVLALLCGILFSVVPALRVAASDPQRALAGASRSSGDGSRQRFLRTIVLAEVAVALVLVTGAGLLTQSFGRMLQVDPGLAREGILTSRISLPTSAYREPAQIREFFDTLEREFERLPGVTGVGAVRRLPLAENAYMEVFLKEGESEDDDQAGRRFEYQTVTTGYFDTVGVRLRSGRPFAITDSADSPRVAIVNEALVAQHFPTEDPVGRSIRILASRPNTEPFLIVGVAEDVLQDGLNAAASAQIYVAHRQATEYVTGATRALVFTLRTDDDPATLAESVRAAVNAIDPDLAVTNTATMEAVVWNSVARPRFLAVLLGLLAGLALLLAGIGVYSVVSYGVEQRTKEFGIRMALGAQPGQVVRMVVAQGARPAIAGAVVGLVGAVAGAQTLGALLFQTNPYDPVTLGGVAVTLIAVALFAAWLPARRAVRVQAVDAIGSD